MELVAVITSQITAKSPSPTYKHSSLCAGQMSLVLANLQCRSTEGITRHIVVYIKPQFLSVFNSHFPSGPGLANTRMFPFWISLELRMMEVVVTTEAIRRAKLQRNRHHQQTNTQLFTGQMPSCHPTNSVRALEN